MGREDLGVYPKYNKGITVTLRSHFSNNIKGLQIAEIGEGKVFTIAK